jgi:hypothetical protein
VSVCATTKPIPHNAILAPADLAKEGIGHDLAAPADCTALALAAR